MKKYTEKIHAERLLKILEKKNPCGCCPASRGYATSVTAGDMWNEGPKVCVEFVGLKYKNINWFDFMNGIRNCPCYKLGKSEAIKRTYISLEEKGYI